VPFHAFIVSGPPLAYWVNHLSPFLVRFSENFGIRYYGLAYVLGFVIAGWLLRRYAKATPGNTPPRSLLPAARVPDVMVAIVLGVLLGGRIGYFLLYQLGTLRSDPLAFFRVWEGGMASHGGFLGVAGALYWVSRADKIPLPHLADLITSTAPAGLFLGRVANFINGELWGKVSNVKWAVIFPHSAPPGTPDMLIPPRHPSQLYEAGLEGLVLFAYMQWRFWRSDVVRTRPGRLSGEFLIAYAIARIICEIFREPDMDVSPLFGLSRGTFYSIFLILAGLALIVTSRRNKRI
jgi:phosphatidylglycerol:prolipoprotein diacylglycerol transferase